MKQLTKEQSIAFFNSKVYEKWDAQQIVKFQLFQDRLCMPFGTFHEAVEKVLKRSIFTHEFAYADGLKKEYLGKKKPPSFSEIIDLIPKEKRIIILES